MTEVLVRHSEVVIFLYVFAEQIGLPLPAVPALLAMGALAAGGKITFGVALAASVAASVLADMIWYTIGRKRGARVLRLLCKISLEPDSCVRRTEGMFVRYGVRSLIVAKFIPGFNTIASPLAGVVGVSVPRFVAYSVAAALLWAGAWGALGYLAGDAVQQIVVASGQLGTGLVVVVMAFVGAYVAVKWFQRQRFLHGLRIARITQEELKRALDAGTPLLVVDLRSALDVAAMPVALPGALRLTPEELEQRHHEIARDRDVVVYCS